MKTVVMGDIGTEFTLDCGVDISTATVRKIIVLKPDGTTVEWPAVASGANEIMYTTIAGDLVVSGVHYLQAQIEMPGWSGSGETASFEVKRKLGT